MHWEDPTDCSKCPLQLHLCDTLSSRFSLHTHTHCVCANTERPHVPPNKQHERTKHTAADQTTMGSSCPKTHKTLNRKPVPLLPTTPPSSLLLPALSDLPAPLYDCCSTCRSAGIASCCCCACCAEAAAAATLSCTSCAARCLLCCSRSTMPTTGRPVPGMGEQERRGCWGAPNVREGLGLPVLAAGL